MASPALEFVVSTHLDGPATLRVVIKLNLPILSHVQYRPALVRSGSRLAQLLPTIIFHVVAML